MRFELEFKGGEHLARTLRALPEALTRKEVIGALKLGGEPIATLMMALAPRRTFSARQRALAHTGYVSLEHLADSIKIRPLSPSRVARAGRDPDTDFAVEIGPTRAHFYGFFLEHGTAHIAARPFARPAFDDGAPSALRAVGKRLWAIVRAHALTGAGGRA
jgi:HK97 gp10 family phage protein